MHTHYLSDDVVDSYLVDLARRLIGLGDEAPLVWVSLGESGDKIAARLADIYEVELRTLAAQSPDVAAPLLEAVRFVRIYTVRGTGRVERRMEITNSDLGRRVLLIDGPIHSGASMLAAVDWLVAQDVESVMSYGLVVKKTSEFIPTFFGLMIGEHDRAFFQLNRIPNNRVLKKGHPFGVLRMISGSDVNKERQSIKGQVDSINKITLSDLWYARKSRGDYVYVYEISGQVAGFVHFYKKGAGAIIVDVLAVDDDYQGGGLAGSLMRWVENWARCHNMLELQLYSIYDRISMYEKFGYSLTNDPILDLGGGEKYAQMKRKILYNIDPEDRQIMIEN